MVLDPGDVTPQVKPVSLDTLTGQLRRRDLGLPDRRGDAPSSGARVRDPAQNPCPGIQNPVVELGQRVAAGKSDEPTAVPVRHGHVVATLAAKKAAVEVEQKRNSGAWVVLVAGKPVLYLSANVRNLTTFHGSITEEGNELALAVTALQLKPRTGCGRMLIRTIDATPALQSGIEWQFLATGFEADFDIPRPPAPG